MFAITLADSRLLGSASNVRTAVHSWALLYTCCAFAEDERNTHTRITPCELVQPAGTVSPASEAAVKLVGAGSSLSHGEHAGADATLIEREIAVFWAEAGAQGQCPHSASQPANNTTGYYNCRNVDAGHRPKPRTQLLGKSSRAVSSQSLIEAATRRFLKTEVYAAVSSTDNESLNGKGNLLLLSRQDRTPSLIISSSRLCQRTGCCANKPA
ncbi:hypothetical protein AOLI_G00297050 [Acnodon oligacanthus]